MAMTQFFLHIHNSHGEAEDDEGLEAESLSEAREKAVAGIRSLLSAEAANGEINFAGRIDISSEAGDVLLSVPFSEAIAVKGL
jgi:hypothetical protein